MNELSLEVSNALNIKVLRLFDTSKWCDDTIENYLIEVLPVNKSKWITFHVQKGFTLALNSSSLGYRKVTDVEQLMSLPDGVYEFKQSYKPNLHTIQQYYHLRTVEITRKLRKEWDKLVDDTCKLSREEFYKNRDKLRDIDEYISAAKWKVEECHEKRVGFEMYEWAVTQLEHYTNECQC